MAHEDFAAEFLGGIAIHFGLPLVQKAFKPIAFHVVHGPPRDSQRPEAIRQRSSGLSCKAASMRDS